MELDIQADKAVLRRDPNPFGVVELQAKLLAWRRYRIDLAQLDTRLIAYVTHRRPYLIPGGVPVQQGRGAAARSVSARGVHG